ncbi:fungal-specific transcription factor domain-containing protein [Crucibulum laeve]|uniref:Fungal-specific transcription factor domain-containing protein n=1 Tax=Crucibulum laeve TaxID=68775 RepID=A0A5C3MEK9_9AGAR|nr:fungal-specific transcription factor domain-containing protein [Crucibulum laeve]
MNPSYPPINGSPYPQQHQQQTPYGTQPGAPIHPAGPPIQSHSPSHYGYPMHASPYTAHHGYPQYPQYTQPMMMYAPQRPSAPPDTPQSAPSPAGASGSDMGRGQSSQQQTLSSSLVDLKKRTKTQRACDSCRSRKIRCDILADAEPPVCQHCKQYGFECTFFLPITETRFKKKKLEEEAEKEKAESSKVSSPSSDSQAKRDVGIFGPTSPAHLLHSQASISSRIYENYDLRYNHTFEVSKTGDGLIQVQKPAEDEQQLHPPKTVDVQIEREQIEMLVNAYFTDVAPILPVVSKVEFLESPNPPPLLLYSMCLVAAARRDVPQKVFDSIRYAVNTIIKAEDTLSTASITNVQSLLILCMMGDCHSQFVPSALSALWIRLGSCIRMAQDLGLHRAESVKHNVDLRRRLWAACLISDRWASLAYGHPYMIDVQDCDARLPSSGDTDEIYMGELVRLSVILGRVLKAIYSPAGLNATTDGMLSQLLEDIQGWKTNLPEHLRFQGTESSLHSGLLHLLYACVCMMFWRVFMRISYSCPAHLKFGLTVEQWTNLVTLTGEAIDWLDAHEPVYDVWLLVAYAATSCALVQYHTWARRKDENAADKLRKLRDCVRRWEGSISPDHMSARRKAGFTAEIISLLYEATQGPPLPLEAPALNPTGGVTNKQPPIGLDYKKDPTRPGGGVFIAQEKGQDFKDLPVGTVISGSSNDTSEGEGASSLAAISSTPLAVVNNNNRDLGTQQPQASPQMQAAPTLSSPTTSSAPLVNFTPLSAGGNGANYTNLNPAMDAGTSATGNNVQVMNVLDGPQGGNTLAEFSIADNNFLDGIPGGMFDWGQWDTFFSRFPGNAQQGDAAGMPNMAAYQQQQQQQAQMQMQQQHSQIQQRQNNPRQSPVVPSPTVRSPNMQQNLPPRFASS